MENYEIIFSILKCIDCLVILYNFKEWGYSKGLIQPKEYHAECQKLINRYKIVNQNFQDFTSLDSFMNVKEELILEVRNKRYVNRKEKTNRRKNWIC